MSRLPKLHKKKMMQFISNLLDVTSLLNSYQSLVIHGSTCSDASSLSLSEVIVQPHLSPKERYKALMVQSVCHPVCLPEGVLLNRLSGRDTLSSGARFA